MAKGSAARTDAHGAEEHKVINVLDHPAGVHESTEAFRAALRLSYRIEVPVVFTCCRTWARRCLWFASSARIRCELRACRECSLTCGVIGAVQFVGGGIGTASVGTGIWYRALGKKVKEDLDRIGYVNQAVIVRVR